MEETHLPSNSCHGFQTQQLYILLVFGIFGITTNLASATYLVKNFTLKKAINQVLITDSIVSILGTVTLVVEFL